MKIKEAAEYLHTTTKTLRFYEEKGLIMPKKDVENQYREYTEQDLYRISTILALREIGLSVNHIKEILDGKSLTIHQYLDIQRSALYEQWIEMRDMIRTIDRMLESKEETSLNNIHYLADHLKGLKKIRSKWQDRWNFDQQAIDYDLNIKKEGHMFNVHEGYDEALQYVKSMVRVSTGEVVVDIGTGTGNLGSKFIEDQVKVIGIDQSEKMLEKCKEKHPEIETRKGHFLAIPLLDGSVDAIVTSYALHHLPDEEKLLALEEMTRILKQGGQICIADLMFKDQNHRESVLTSYKAKGNYQAISAIEDEYYANQSVLVNWLKKHHYRVEYIQLNDILGIIYGVREE